MCFSAIVEQDLARLKREFKAKPDLGAFKKLFGRRASGEKIIIPRAMEDNFRFPAASADEADIATMVAEHRRKLDLDYREKLKEQQERLADAQTALARKITKTWQNEARIAGNKIRAYEEKIADLPRRTTERQDNRIFPLHYAPVVIVEKGERVIKPMRYLLRRPGDSVKVDDLRNGCYNALGALLTVRKRQALEFTER